MSRIPKSTAEKCIYIYGLAKQLNDDKRPMSGMELVDHLNKERITTLKGTSYKYGRGIFVLINTAYKYIEDTIGKDEAKLIALAFLNKKGEGAWWKKPV